MATTLTDIRRRDDPLSCPPSNEWTEKMPEILRPPRINYGCESTHGIFVGGVWDTGNPPHRRDTLAAKQLCIPFSSNLYISPHGEAREEKIVALPFASVPIIASSSLLVDTVCCLISLFNRLLCLHFATTRQRCCAAEKGPGGLSCCSVCYV